MPITSNLRRISCLDEAGTGELHRLRRQLASHGQVVSEKGRRLTEEVFGEALAPVQVVERICRNVQQRGLEALLEYSRRLDKADLDRHSLRVGIDELRAAHASVDASFLQTIRRVAKNVTTFQSGLLQKDAVLAVHGKYELRVRYRPMRRVGVCVPGGAAAYPSTLLMTVCPAKAAGVAEIAVMMPPTAMGAYNDDLLATCWELGVDEVYRMGGAQGVAALAYGVEGIEPVDMIVGPGNVFVTLAKKFVFGQVAIDCLAGPSEVVVVADETADPAYVAADLIAQAEHDPATSILISWNEQTLDAVADEIHRQLERLERREAAARSLEMYGALVRVRDDRQAVEIVNSLAPEHLHIQAENAERLAEAMTNAGAVFVGPFSPVALGDYAAGPSHVLPTGGTARFASGLSATDFLRRSSVLHFSRDGLADLADDVRLLAHKEGLTGHAASVDIRLE